MKVVIGNKFKLFLLMLFLINSSQLLAQTYSKIKTFTTEDGLPSNHVYDVTEDSKGFLWVATDNGVARFDGKYFKNFSVRNGLPSNDVLQVLQGRDGTVWVNCYKKPPAYYDQIKNEFITLNNAITRKYCNVFYNYFIGTQGNVAFYLGGNYFELHHKNITRKELRFRSTMLNDDSFVDTLIYTPKTKTSFEYLYLLTKNNQKKLVLKSSEMGVLKITNQQAVIRLTAKGFYQISKVNSKDLTFKLDSIKPTKEIKWFKLAGDKLCLNFADNSIGIYDKNTLQPLETITNTLHTNLAFIDKNNNAWICTLNDGLQLFQKNSLQNKSYTNITPNKNFLSVEVSPSKAVYLGNDAGEVLVTQNKKTIKHNIISTSTAMWLRKIMYANNKIIVVHDNGISIDFQPTIKILKKDKRTASLKTAVKANDSIILFGYNSGLIKYNYHTLQVTYPNSPETRVTTIIKASETIFYYVSGIDLYCYDMEKDTSIKIILPSKTAHDTPAYLAYDQNKTLWVTTISGDILMLENNKVVKKINSSIGLPENITCLLSVQNKLWIGSKSGIYIFNTTTDYFTNLSTVDGLSTNFINELAFANDTIYAATSNGLIKIDSKMHFHKFNIVPQVVSVKINNIPIKIAKAYILKSNQNDIFIRLSGVELTGHFQKFQYAINNTKRWNDLAENTLNLQLNSGISTIYIRVINSSNQVGSKIITLTFDICNPFYKTLWFWLFNVGYVILITIGIIYYRKQIKQKRAFKQQLGLEQQRNKITADLHDDIGATLSSLQLNSAIAHQLIKKDLPKTEALLEKIENQSKDLADKIGDIIWSMKPGKDEFMTISSRIKNFANDILGATNINYTITINSEIDGLLTDITTRKNTVLIAKETLNNVAKYSQAKNVHITFEKENNTLLLSIIDDGIGFNPENIKGNGILNIKKRALEINGTLRIVSSEKNGTAIILQIPCP